MVKHIVLFKLKDEVPADEKLVAMNNFKKAIEALPAKISVIRKIEVGLNINPAETWSIALYSEFDTLDDVKFYAVHRSCGCRQAHCRGQRKSCLRGL